MGLMTKLKSMFLLLRDRKNGRFAVAGCPVPLLLSPLFAPITGENIADF
ncbi:hypothetical protein ALP89_200015 [Pseudomonas syringae pv. persicae]|nr:hypothetical protein ALP89_200015 [Pseudomonas syringae pv. persicae]